MKNKILFTALALMLVLSMVLAACGDDKEKEKKSTADTAISAAGSTASVVEHTGPEMTFNKSPKSSSAASKPSSTTASKPSSSAVSAPASSAGGNTSDKSGSGSSHQSGTSSAPASSAASKPSSSSSGSVKPAPNPAYDKDEKPKFTITVTDKKTKKSYSAACTYTDDKEKEAYSAFFLYGGEYEIAVYNYSEDADRGDPLATATYKNDINAKKRRNVRVTYIPGEKKINVTAPKPNPQHPTTASSKK